VKGVGLEREVVRYAALLWVLSRAGFVAITLLATHFLRHIGGSSDFLGTWARFDATYYARLARDNYQASLPYRAAFFPLDPLAIRIVTPLVGGNAYVAGMVVASVCFFIALLGIGTLTRLDHDLPTARRAMLYLTIYPAALFLFAGYSEALLLALAAWCLVAIRQHRWWQAGVLGLLAAMTRQVGLLLVLPFAWEYAKAAGWKVRGLRFSALAVVLIPCGVLLFMAWLWHSMGDPLAFLHAEKSWHRALTPPWDTLAAGVAGMWRMPDTISWVRSLADLGAVVLFAALIVVGARRQPVGYTLYSAGAWLLPLLLPTSGWSLESDARYMMAAIPCFIVLAALGKRPGLNAGVICVFALGLFLLTQYFVRGAIII
jgi:Mannosyltransferase (PIG-V)